MPLARGCVALTLCIGAVSLVVTLLHLPRLAGAALWSADAVAPSVLAESFWRDGLFGQRTLLGDITSLWDVATFTALEPLPFHRQLWLLVPYATSLVTAAFFAAAVARASRTRLAGFATFAMLISVATVVQFSQIAPAYRGSSWLLMGVFAYLAVRTVDTPETVPFVLRSTVGRVVLGIVAAILIASDPLTILFAVIPITLVLQDRRRHLRAGETADTSHFQAVVIAALIGAVALLAALAKAGISSSGNRSTSRVLTIASREAMLQHLEQIWRNLLAILGVAKGANTPSNAIGWVPVAVFIVLVGLLVRFLADSHWRSRLDRSLRALTIYVTAGVGLLLPAYVVSTAPVPTVTGAENARYLVPLWIGLAVLLPAYWARARPGAQQLAAAVAMAILVVPGAVAIANSEIIHERERGTLAAEHENIADYLRARGATEGLSGYWDANPLRFRSGLHVVAVRLCKTARHFCPVRLNARASWYEGFRQTQTFVIVKKPATSGFTEQRAIRVFGTQPTERRSFGRITVLIFPMPASQYVDPLE
jgi:hypothetical protein